MSTEAMMPISADTLHYRTILFELSKPVTIPPKYLTRYGHMWIRFIQSFSKSCCKLMVIKRRQSSIRNANLCNVRIKVSRLVDGTTVTVEHLDEHTHTHDIEESFRIKKPSILVGYIKSKAVKNYSASQIYHAIRGAGTHEGTERLKELGGSSLKTKDIMNLKRGLGSADLRALLHGKLFEDDILHACSLLKERGWLFEQLHVVDSKWQPRYIMTDDSAIEQRTIRLAFPGLNAGEQEVAHLLCSVHSNRTLLQRLGSNTHKSIYQLLKHAMYCFTEIKNRELCEEVIAAADEETAKYIRTYWLQNAPKWAMYARQHSPFLLQATTTNACEAWHRKLKSGAGLSKGQVASHGIYGMILNIIDATNDVDNRAELAKSHFRNRKLAVCTKQYAEIGQLPVPIQKLLARELDAVEERIAKGKELPRFDENLWCHCKFHRQYLLPCRHIFHLDTEIKVLTPAQWKGYLMMFEECGMEVYETMGTVWVENECSGRNAERANIISWVRESFEQVQQQLYSAYELMDQLHLDDDTVQSQRMEEWANHVQVTLGSLTSVRAEDIVNRHRPWELS
ncbi:hypothetical protein BGX38DRAFT_1335203 [Terfezia claveryi]|nr:hypothetical protein BGX38DRAFT_1335203 [Terfezia claveryi]